MKLWALILALSQAASALSAPAPQASLPIADRHGRPLRLVPNAQSLDSRPLPLEQISPWLLLATVAVEDQRFYEHGGLDLKAVARASAQNLRAGKVVSGASTLTQQLARALEPRPRSFWGKLKEARKAFSLEREMSKAQILEAYLNHAPYGNQRQGAEAAARFYFGVPAADLSLAQAALLAGIPKSPARFDPLRHPQAARQRRDQVLAILEKGGWVDAASLRLARTEPWRVEGRRAGFAAPHFTQMLRARTSARGPLRATLDGELQEDLQALLRAQLQPLRERHVRNAALLVLDNASGEVLAWVGSQDFNDAAAQGQVDGVTALRQPGSTLKPFLYGLAFEQGMVPADRIEDQPWVAPDGYAAYNYDRRYRGSISLREALASSYNVPAVRLAHRVGSARLLHRLRALGFDSLDRGASHYGLGLALGNGEVTLLELANAYATLGRLGRYLPVQTVLDGSLEPLGQAPHRVLSEASAWLVLDVLSDNAARAPAFGMSSSLNLPFPLAAKTGTTKDYRDNWCVGVTMRWTVAAWSGNFDGSPMRQVSGVTGAGPLMQEAALRVQARYPSAPFRRPKGLFGYEVCADSGALPSPRCQRRAMEHALADSPNPRPCPLHPMASAAAAARRARPSIVVPAQGATYLIDPGLDRDAQVLGLLAEGVLPGDRLSWTVDGESPALDGRGEPFYRLARGYHQVALSVFDGRRTRTAETVSFRVLQ